MALFIFDIKNKIFTSDIVNFVYKEFNCYNQELQCWYQKYIFRNQKWTLLLVTITLLISIIDIFTSRNKNLIPEIKNEGDERRDLDVSDKCLMNANGALQSSRGWWNIASQHELWCTAHSLLSLCALFALVTCAESYKQSETVVGGTDDAVQMERAIYVK